jgi:putative oxidoreductase
MPAMRNESSTVDLGLLVLRLGAGGMLLALHGWGKVANLLSGQHEFGDPLGIGPLPSLILAAAAEFLFSLLVVLGVQVRWTAIPPLITMAVAAFIAHGNDPLGDGEQALLYLVAFLALVFTGAGRYSFDGWWRRRKRR